MITRSSGCSVGANPCLHPRQKHLAIHGPFKQPRGASPVQAHGGNERAGLIMSVRNMGDEPFADRSASTQTGHLGVGPAFIHEHEPGGWLRRQLFVPVRPLFGHVGPVLLGGVQRFFYSSTPAAAAINPPSKFQTDDPDASPTPPAWHPAGRPPAFAGGPCAGRSGASCVRTSGFAVPRCPAP